MAEYCKNKNIRPFRILRSTTSFVFNTEIKDQPLQMLIEEITPDGHIYFVEWVFEDIICVNGVYSIQKGFDVLLTRTMAGSHYELYTSQ